MGLREYYDDYYFGFARRRRLKLTVITAAVGLLFAIGVLVFVSNNEDTPSSIEEGPPATSTPTAEVTPTAESSTSVAVSTSDEAAAATSAETVEVSPTDDASATTEVSATTDVATTEETTETAATSTDDGSDDTVAASAVSSPSTTGVASGSTTPKETGPPATLADGQPVPVVAVFDTDTITLTGAVPSQAAVDRLVVLAVANSKTPAYVINNLVINPAVPINVGVRVLELNSVRFPDGSAVVLPEHGIELDRVAAVMAALPNVSVLVIGHADQRGSEAKNFAISDERARAVVNYLVFVGIRADRLSSRAVGAADLLAINDDAASLALNRRTEFIFYGLLIE